MTEILDAPEKTVVNPWEFDRKHAAYIEFLVGLRGQMLRHVNQQVGQLYQQKREALLATGQPDPVSLEAVDELMVGELSYQLNRAMVRKSQEMMWSGIQDGLAPNKAALLDQLNAPTKSTQGGLELNPALELPDYYARHEFHIQPGSYYANDMCAYVFEWGNKVYFLKTNDDNQTQKAMAAVSPTGNFKTIVDLGTSTGKCAMAYAALYPDAQVWALDLAAPLLKLGHKMAVERGFENIIFSQQNAELTTFPDNSVDMVTAFILFHEVSAEARQNIVKEVYRILKPGGWFVNGDTTPLREAPAWTRYVSSWQTKNNGEPYWYINNAEANLLSEMSVLGFNQVREFGAAASKLSAKFPWVTIGQK